MPDTAGKIAVRFAATDPPEKMVALDVAQRLEQKLRESQIKTVMTRDSDVFIPLNDRVAIENKQKNAVFVSIHFNDSRKRRDPRIRDLLSFRCVVSIWPIGSSKNS